MLAWKVAPALAAGNTVVLKPAEFTPLTALLFAEIAAGGRRCRRACSTSSPATGDTGAALVDHAGRRQDRLHRLDRGRARHPQGDRGHAASGCRSSWAASRRSSSSTTPISTAPSRAWSTRSGSTRARSAAPARGCSVQESIDRRFIEKLRARMEKLRVGDPLDKAMDIGAIVAPVQLERIRRWSQQGVSEGAEMLAAARGPARRTAASIRRRCSPNVAARRRPGAGRDLRPGARRDDVPHARRGGRAGQQHALRPGRERLDRERQPRAGHRAARSRPASSGSTATNLFDAAAASAAIARAASAARAGARGCTSTCTPHRRRARPRRDRRRLPAAGADAHATTVAPLDRPHAQALHRRQAGAARPRLQPPVLGADGAVLGEVGEGNRKDIRNAVEAAHAALPAGPGDGAQPRADPLLHRREPRGARRRVRAAHRRSMTGPATARREVEAAIERLFTYAAWADKYDGAVHQVPLRGVDAGDARADRRDRRSSAPTSSRCSASSRCVGAGDRDGQHASSPSRPSAPAVRDRLLPGAGDLRRAGRRGQHRHRRARRAGAGAGRARRRGRGLVLRLARRACRRSKLPRAGNMKRTWADRTSRATGSTRRRRGARVPARGDPGQEHLDRRTASSRSSTQGFRSGRLRDPRIGRRHLDRAAAAQRQARRQPDRRRAREPAVDRERREVRAEQRRMKAVRARRASGPRPAARRRPMRRPPARGCQPRLRRRGGTNRSRRETPAADSSRARPCRARFALPPRGSPRRSAASTRAG